MAASPGTTLVGVFESRADAEQALADLNALGFADEDLGIAVRSTDEAATGGTATGEGASAAAGGMETESAEGAGVGLVAGGILGAVAALLIPGVGPAIAGGLLSATVLASAAVGAGLGALAGALIGLGIPEEEARYYQSEFEQGRAVVTVRADGPGRQQQARDVLDRYGAYDVHRARGRVL
jgi:hypothetical protein